MNLEGTYYFPANHLEVSGEGMMLGNQIITWTMRLQGTSEFWIAYDGSFATGGQRVFLVE